jgi:serine/threonine protein kinase
MLERFRSAGFAFGPSVLSVEDSIRLLVDEGGVSILQAELRVKHHDVLVMEYLNGIPFATQTGRHINYDFEIGAFDQELLSDVLAALNRLRRELDRANTAGLLHNDPMPPNIIFDLDDNNVIRAWLVDFELAQDLNGPSPEYVNNSVAELYRERNVPLNVHTGKYLKNLDQHLIDECIRVVQEFLPIATKVRDVADSLEGVSVSVSIPFIAGISFNLGRFLKLLRRR